MCSPIVRRMRESGSARGGRGRRARLGLGPVGRLDVQRRLGVAAGAVRPRRTRARPACARGRRGRCPRRGEVDAVLGGDALDDGRVRARRGRRWPSRRVAPARGRGSRRRSRRRLRRRARGCASPGRASVVDPREHRADVDRLARPATRISASAPGGRRRDLGVDLVGRDLADRLVGLDPVADLLAPLDDRALGDRDAHLRHGDVDERLSSRGAHGTPPGRGRRTAARACSSGGENGIGTSGVATRHDRAVEVLEAALGDQRRDLGAGRARLVGLVDDHDLRAVARRCRGSPPRRAGRASAGRAPRPTRRRGPRSPRAPCAPSRRRR